MARPTQAVLDRALADTDRAPDSPALDEFGREVGRYYVDQRYRWWIRLIDGGWWPEHGPGSN